MHSIDNVAFMFLGGKIDLNFSLIITFQTVVAVGIFFKVVIKKIKLNFFIIKIELEYINIARAHKHTKEKRKKKCKYIKF